MHRDLRRDRGRRLLGLRPGHRPGLRTRLTGDRLRRPRRRRLRTGRHGALRQRVRVPHRRAAPPDQACVDTPPSTAYWAYYHAVPGDTTWRYSTLGAAASAHARAASRRGRSAPARSRAVARPGPPPPRPSRRPPRRLGRGTPDGRRPSPPPTTPRRVPSAAPPGARARPRCPRRPAIATGGAVGRDGRPARRPPSARRRRHDEPSARRVSTTAAPIGTSSTGARDDRGRGPAGVRSRAHPWRCGTHRRRADGRGQQRLAARCRRRRRRDRRASACWRRSSSEVAGSGHDASVGGCRARSTRWPGGSGPSASPSPPAGRPTRCCSALILAVAGLVVVARGTDAPWARAFPSYLELGAHRDRHPGRVPDPARRPIPDRASTCCSRLPTIPLPGWLAGVSLGGPVSLEGVLAARLRRAAPGHAALLRRRRQRAGQPEAAAEVAARGAVRARRRGDGRADARAAAGRERAARAPRPPAARRGRAAAPARVRGIVDPGPGGRARPVARCWPRRWTPAATDGAARPTAAPGAPTAALLLVGLLGICVGVVRPARRHDARAASALPRSSAGVAAVRRSGSASAAERVRRTRYRPDPWRAPEWVAVRRRRRGRGDRASSAGRRDRRAEPVRRTRCAGPRCRRWPASGVLLAALPAVVARRRRVPPVARPVEPAGAERRSRDGGAVA